MKKFLRKTRLVHALLSFGGGLFRFLAALVNMASNYGLARYEKMGAPFRSEAGTLGLRPNPARAR